MKTFRSDPRSTGAFRPSSLAAVTKLALNSVVVVAGHYCTSVERQPVPSCEKTSHQPWRPTCYGGRERNRKRRALQNNGDGGGRAFWVYTVRAALYLFEQFVLVYGFRDGFQLHFNGPTRCT